MSKRSERCKKHISHNLGSQTRRYHQIAVDNKPLKQLNAALPRILRRDFNCKGVQEPSRAVDLRCSVLVSHPTPGEVHKMSSDHVFKSVCFECRCISCGLPIKRVPQSDRLTLVGFPHHPSSLGGLVGPFITGWAVRI